ncbi:hypothetical protein BX666DRAFT_1857866 [Dichotomocladium elegans]|nr:hypothetical protein BX666DRAFT_1857866 [Dichotomocladium elegans]
MTVENGFPIGYFYIVSKLNGLVLDLRGPQETAGGAKVVMAEKVTESPDRDSQLWIHQSGFLTNKATGLVLDINKAEAFIAIFTREKRLYLDGMKEKDAADDQQFGYESDTGYIYQLSDANMVVDIRHEDPNVDARVMIYKRKPVPPENPDSIKNQLWTLELSDPPRQVDSDDEDEDDSKRARIRAWFGNWKGWGDRKKEVLSEDGLHEAHEKVYNDEKKRMKSHLSSELIAGAVGYEAVHLWEKKRSENGEEDLSKAKKMIAEYAATELVKLLASRGERNSDGDDKPSMKQKLMTQMAIMAATNYFESRHGSH